MTKDVTELIARTQELREQAHHDALTGLLNRRAGEQQLERCQRTAQIECQSYALILADIDNFKSINDRFGHDEGDRVLQRCATLLSRKVRSGDALIRWGGEEFLIVLPGCRLEAAQELAERIRAAMAQEQDADTMQAACDGQCAVVAECQYSQPLARCAGRFKAVPTGSPPCRRASDYPNQPSGGDDVLDWQRRGRQG